jgi:hypothetical protein
MVRSGPMRGGFGARVGNGYLARWIGRGSSDATTLPGSRPWLETDRRNQPFAMIERDYMIKVVVA